MVLFGAEGPDGSVNGTEFEPGLIPQGLQMLVSLKQYLTFIFPLESLSVMVTLPPLQVPTETELQASPEQEASAICGTAPKATVVANAKPSLCRMVVSPPKERDRVRLLVWTSQRLVQSLCGRTNIFYQPGQFTAVRAPTR